MPTTPTNQSPSLTLGASSLSLDEKTSQTVTITANAVVSDVNDVITVTVSDSKRSVSKDLMVTVVNTAPEVELSLEAHEVSGYGDSIMSVAYTTANITNI